MRASRIARACRWLLAVLSLLGVVAHRAHAAANDPSAPQSPSPAGTAAAATTGGPRGFEIGKLPFIPIPEIDTGPQSGLTLGLLPVVLSNNARGEIDRILAPDIIHSQYFGWGARWRTFSYPSDDEKWSVVAGAKQRVEREFDAEYDQGMRRDGDWSWIAHAMYDRSGTGRFFGLGNHSLLRDQTNYTESQTRLELTAARNFSRTVQLSYLARVEHVDIGSRALASLPSIQTLYPGLPGLGHVTDLQQRLVLTYDTRDSDVVPRSGDRLAAFAGISAHALGSTRSYTFLGVDMTTYQAVGPALTVVGHAALRYMPSYTDAPFWDLSALGGDRSIIGEAQPLRAYGDDRFVGRNSFATSLEARFWVSSFHLFDTDLKLELAPFVDSGKVFDAMARSPLSHLHVGGGMGFRVIASPYVVAYVDVGFGKEKAAVFSGIDYPF
ncbi:MAG TPA: BamA/TamA family outer membrane protein [Casimicrobiaceae bacterium]|nr:BamA/TamA family outer membrane protein [Casimicrobiaceae bacterium]